MTNPQSLDFSWEENTEQSRSAGGSLRSDGAIAYRTLAVDVSFVDETQRAELADHLRYAGRRKDIFLSSKVRERDRDVPLAFITGWGLHEEDQRRCRALGITHVLFKTVSPADLHRVVQQTLREHARA